MTVVAASRRWMAMRSNRSGDRSVSHYVNLGSTNTPSTVVMRHRGHSEPTQHHQLRHRHRRRLQSSPQSDACLRRANRRLSRLHRNQMFPARHTLEKCLPLALATLACMFYGSTASLEGTARAEVLLKTNRKRLKKEKFKFVFQQIYTAKAPSRFSSLCKALRIS